jgi:tripartite-type tricarboxylate transporter receptor subunit TctC
MKLLCFSIGLAAAVFFCVFGFAGAEYPDRPITLIANYSAGGGADLSSRALAKKAEKFLGQPIAVVNKAGAAGTIGVGARAASRPDGYTIGVTTSGTLTMGPHIYDLPYDPFKSFDFIMGYGRYLYGPCVRSDSPFKTLQNLVQYAKANPGKVKFSHIGLASPNHFGMMMLAKAENIQWEPVIFKETTAAVTACLGGHVDVVSQNPGDVVPYIKAGRLRLLASLCDGRWEWVPDVPTARELGYKFDVEAWLGLGLPKGAPKPILDKLRDAFKKSMDDPEFLDVMKKIYIPAAYRSAEEYQKLIEVTYPQYEGIIKELGLHKSQQKK